MMILAANTSSTTRVAVYTPHRKLAGHLHRVVARAGGGDDRCPRASILSITVNLPAIQSTPVTSFERVIAAFLPLRRRLAGKLERSGPVADGVRFPAFVTSYEGPRAGFVNLGRPLVAAGKPSFLCSLLKHRQEPRSGIFETFSLTPAFLSAPVHHGNNHDSRSVGNAQIPSGEIRNVVR